MFKNIGKTVYKVNDFLSWQRSNSLVLSPSFQRRPVWPKGAKSFLIDTVVTGLPMPIIFLREQIDINTLEPIREVVDGQQRLRTIISFVDSSLISDFNPSRDEFTVNESHNPRIAGKRFNQLDIQDRKRILNYEFSVHILTSDTEDRDVLQIFARMNSTGVKLNGQELRNAEFFGSFKNLAYDLAYQELNRWRDWGVFTENDIARMLEVEETSDLLSLMISGVHGKNQDALDNLYKEYEEKDIPFKNELIRRFRIVMDKIDETLGADLKKNEFSRKALFNTLFTFYYDLIFKLDSPLEKKVPPKPLSNKVKKVVDKASIDIKSSKLNEQLAKVLRGATAHKKSRDLRLQFLKKIYAKITT